VYKRQVQVLLGSLDREKSVGRHYYTARKAPKRESMGVTQ
jgi:hypothetical protein